MSSKPLDRAAERAQVYQLLSRLWRDVPDRELLEHLSGLSVADMPPVWSKLVAACDTDEEQLATEFTRLLIGPKDHLPPFQSVWREHQLGGESVSSMKLYADVAGAEHVDDHLASQLELMSQMLIDAAAHEDPTVVEVLSSYFRDHLAWPVSFLKAVRNRSQLEFFASLATLTGDFLSDESAALQLEAS